MTNVLVLQHRKIIDEMYKHTRYHLQYKTDQYISVNNNLRTKLCLAIELTSDGGVKLWAL